MTELTDIPTRAATVTGVDDVGPGLRQIRFGGLDGHRPIGPDDFFLVIRPRPGDEHLLDDGTTFAQIRELPEDRRPEWAYYTCRRWRAERGELDAWFVLHGHERGVSGWAARAEIGDRVLLWGPRAAYDPPAGTGHVLLVGDETGLGAFAGVLESAPAELRVTAVVESDDGDPVVDLPRRDGADVRWISRDGAPRGTGTSLLDAVAALDLDVDDLYAYGAGESRLVTAVRTHLRRDRGVPRAGVEMVGYWRRC